MRHAIWVLAVLGVLSPVLGGIEDSFPASVLEDARSTTLQLLEKYKYPAESHQVTTEDKYVLTLHRIPRPGAKPVLLVHGLQDTSSTWILMGPDSGLGYYLYDNGYDVWLGNCRGNRYSRSHAKLNPNTDKAYWSFSWHEIGMYDLPAMIDAVLAKTGYEKLSYFGHSQGTTSFFVMASSRTEYNDKIHVMSALAPVAFMRHIKTPLVGITRMGIGVLGESFELLPHSFLYLNQCLQSAGLLKTCVRFYFQVVGKNREELNMTMFPLIVGHIPGGCNVKQTTHYLQLQSSDRFCQFDYDSKENQRLYGRPSPPDYRLEKITAPVALYYGSNDFLAGVEDVQRLAKLLPNVVENHMYRKWNHMDMHWGISSRRTVMPRLLQVMQYWESGEGRKVVTTASAVEEEVTQLATETSMERRPVTERVEDGEVALEEHTESNQGEDVEQEYHLKEATDDPSEDV